MADQPLPDHNRLTQYILQPVMVPRDPVWQEVLDAGRDMLETVFPSEGETKLTRAQLRRNSAIMEALRSGQSNMNIPWLALVSGSRAEGLALESGWGHEPPDLDTLFIYGTLWTVHIRGGSAAQAPPQSRLEMVIPEGYPPCFCRVRVLGNLEDMVEALGQEVTRGFITHMDITTMLVILIISSILNTYWFMFLIGVSRIPWLWGDEEDFAEETHSSLNSISRILPRSLNFVVPWSQGGNRARTVFLQMEDGFSYLSSAGVQKLLSDRNFSGVQCGPSQQLEDRDLVPALICSQPFPCIRDYLRRTRHSTWPRSEARADIAVMPGLIVPTGDVGSTEEERQMQWRDSFSAQELRLALDMPPWVKAGYRAFKYTFKATYKRLWPQDPNSHARRKICTFHMKTTLLWCLEQDAGCWDDCSFRLMIRLLCRLYGYLASHTLPHYFNEDCNLLEFVPRVESVRARSCVRRILRDPVSAMVQSPIFPRQLLGVWGSVASFFSGKTILDEKEARYRAALVAARL